MEFDTIFKCDRWMFKDLLLLLLILSIPGCQEKKEQVHHELHKVVVTTPVAKDVVSTQQYVCQIHSHRHIDIRALESGYLEKITVKEGQTVKQGETLFAVIPTLYQARLDAELAEAQLAQLEFNNTQKLYQDKVVSQNEVALYQAKLAKAKAKVKLAEAELNFATVKAPFDGIVDRLHEQQGSLVAEGDILTTLSDNEVMWVYFNVPEARYLEYKANPDRDSLKVELVLANGSKFSETGKIAAIEADFNNQTGNIAFRADFPNPDRLLRHGQTGTILLSRVLKDALVIPQRATFEILDKKYAYVVEESTEEPSHSETHTETSEPHGGNQRERGIARQREIFILNELEDIYLIKRGLDVNEKIVLEGIRQVRDGAEVEYEFLSSEVALENLKYHAE